MDTLNSILAAFIAVCTLIAALAPLILALLAKIKDERLRKLGEAAVAFAEQVAKQHEKITGEKMKPTEKYGLAESKILEIAKATGIKVKPEAVSFLIESALGKGALRK